MCTGLSEYCPNDFSGYIWYLDRYHAKKNLNVCLRIIPMGPKVLAVAGPAENFACVTTNTKIATLDVSNIIKVNP